MRFVSERLGKICLRKFWANIVLIVATTPTTQSEYIDKLELIVIIKRK